MNKISISHFNNLENAREHWLAIEKESEYYYFQSFSWCNCWFNNFGKELKVSPLIIVVAADNVPVALFPLGLQSKFGMLTILRWLCCTISDYNAPVFSRKIEQNEISQITEEVFRYVKSVLSYDMTILHYVPELLANGSCNPVMSTKLALNAENIVDRTAAPYIVIGDWDEYYNGINKKIRSDSIRQRKRLDESGKVEIIILDNIDEIYESVNKLFEFKESHYGHLSNSTKSFYLEMSKIAFNEHALHISQITVNKELAAIHWGFVFKDRFYYLMPSFDDKYKKYSVGRLLMEHLIAKSFQSKLKVFDLCVGSEKYKDEWANKMMKVVSYSASNNLKGRFVDNIYKSLKKKNRS